MDWQKLKNKIEIFVKNIPDTLKKTSVWLIISYLIPLINIFIIWGIRGDSFYLDINIVSIILVTNACFLTSLLYLVDKKKEITNILSIVTFVVSVILFAFSIAQMELRTTIFPLTIYQYGALITLIISIIFGLISKYNEVEAAGKERANEAKNTTSTTIAGKTINI